MMTNNQFCYWDCKSFPDAIILMINSFVTFVILVLAIGYCYQFYKVYNLNLKSSRAVYIKFFGIIGWALCFIINVCFSVVVYSNEFDQQTDEQLGPSITFYSRLYAFLQTIPAMIIQSLLYTTAQTMITNSMAVLLQNQHQPSKSQSRVYKAIRNYYKLRYLFIICWVMVLIPFHNPETFQIITQVKTTLLMIDCAIIIGLLRFCHRYMLNNSQMLLPDRTRDRRRLISQTRLLTVCGVCRLLLNLTFYIIFPIIFANLSDKSKPCIQDAIDHLEFTIGYLAIGTYMMSHACIITIIKIYKPGDNRTSLMQSGSFTYISNQINNSNRS